MRAETACSFFLLVTEEEEADLIWLYILGGFLGLILILILFLVCCRVKKEKDIEDEAMKEREEGIHKTWGVKTDVFIVDDDGVSRSIHEDRTIDGETRNESTMNLNADLGKDKADAAAAPMRKNERR